MHLIATNLCVWLRVITIETVREIHKFLPETIEDIGFNEAIGLPDSDFIISPPKDEHSGLRNFSRYDQQHHIHKRASSHSDGHGNGNFLNMILFKLSKKHCAQEMISRYYQHIKIE